MNRSRKLVLAVALGSIMLSGCVSKVTEKEQYSGYLESYQDLKPAKSSSGVDVMRWVSPTFYPGSYNTVVFNQLDLFPAPKADDRVDMKTFQQLQQTMSDSALAVLGKKYKVVRSLQAVPSGSRTLIMYAAITGVSASDKGMQWYEVVPVAAVIGGVSAATGHRDQNSVLYIEAFLVDATTGRTEVKVVRKVFGEMLNNSSQKVTAADFNNAIKGLASDMNAFLK